MKLAYVANRYPWVSHAFLLREVEALRELGVQVETFSIWRTRPEDLHSEAEREACRTTFAVLPCGWRRLLGDHLHAFAARPVRYLATLALAQRLSPPGPRARLWQLFYFAEAMVLWRACRRAGVRHIHAQFADSATDTAMLVAHFESAAGGADGWSWSLAVHGPVEFYDVSRNGLAEKVRRARFVLAISDFGRSQLMTLVNDEHWPKIHVVRCGIDPRVYTRCRRRRSGDAPLHILTVGRLVQLKGHAILLEAVADLVRRGLPVNATLVGDGPERRRLERRCRQLGLADRVALAGAVGHDDIVEYYRSADIFCLASFAEGLPVVLMEAMALGLPVVATRIMGVPELVDDGVNGLLVPPGRPQALAGALERLITAPERRREMGDAGRAKVLAEFDVHRSAREFRRVLDECLAEA